MSAQVLRSCFWYSGSVLSIIPLKGSYVKNRVLLFKPIVIRPIIRYSWWLFFIFSLFFTSFDLYNSLTLYKTKNIVRIAYHIFMFLNKTASTAVSFVFQNKSYEICKLLNYFFQKSSVSKSTKTSVKCKKRSNMFTIFLWSSNFGIVIFYLLITPIFALTFSCVHNNPLVEFLFNDCKALKFRIVIYVIQFLFMLHVSAMGPLGFCTVLVTLSELTRNLENLW